MVTTIVEFRYVSKDSGRGNTHEAASVAARENLDSHAAGGAIEKVRILLDGDEWVQTPLTGNFCVGV